MKAGNIFWREMRRSSTGGQSATVGQAVEFVNDWMKDKDKYNRAKPPVIPKLKIFGEEGTTLTL